jgi:haloalkane dehalogenase
MTYTEAGEGGVPVVFLHGNPPRRTCGGTLSHLSAGTRCLAPDLIGMGGSGKPDIAYRLADHAGYLDALFDALGLKDVVVGHTWGGVRPWTWPPAAPGSSAGSSCWRRS